MGKKSRKQRKKFKLRAKKAKALKEAIKKMSGEVQTITGHSHNMSINLPTPLSAEEREELGRLKNEREEQTKIEKEKMFTDLPESVREDILFEARRTKTAKVIETIGDHKATRSQEETDLEMRDGNGMFGHVWSHGMSFTTSYPNLDNIPNYERLCELHAEVAMEQLLTENSD